MKKAFILLVSIILTGCVVGRTGKLGKPIAAAYQQQINQLKLGETTPDDLRRIFSITVTNGAAQPVQAHPGQPQQRQTQIVTTKKVLVSLKEASIENGKKVEIYEIAKGGGMDVGEFVMWGIISYNKDQEMDFRFEDGKLVSYESIIIPDPPQPPPPEPVSKTPR